MDKPESEPEEMQAIVKPGEPAEPNDDEERQEAADPPPPLPPAEELPDRP